MTAFPKTMKEVVAIVGEPLAVVWAAIQKEPDPERKKELWAEALRVMQGCKEWRELEEKHIEEVFQERDELEAQGTLEFAVFDPSEFREAAATPSSHAKAG